MPNPTNWIQGGGKPALHLIETRNEGKSHWGGLPVVPGNWTWPMGPDGPMDFLACLDLAEVQALQPTDWLPPTGQLLFFYDTEDQPWGYQPEDRKRFQVQYISDDQAQQEATGQSRGIIWPKRNMTFRPIKTYYDGNPDTIDGLTEKQEEDLREFVAQENYKEKPAHQVLGYPFAVQDPEMGSQCELVSNGIDTGRATAYSSPETRRLISEGGSKDWRLLLQIDSDDDAGWMWGDTGMLYFLIKEVAAKERKFDQAWMVLQCF